MNSRMSYSEVTVSYMFVVFPNDALEYYTCYADLLRSQFFYTDMNILD